MKGASSIQKFKKHQKTLLFKQIRNRKKIRKRKSNIRLSKAQHFKSGEISILAPVNFCLLQNPLECTAFFSKMRHEYRFKSHYSVILALDCSKVESLDFPTVILFKAVIRELQNKGVPIKGILPNNIDCKRYFIEAGFLKNMYDSKGHKFNDPGKSIILKIEKGNGMLTLQQSIAITGLLNSSTDYLLGRKVALIKLKSVLKEICGNSIEWGEAYNKFWMMGAKFDDRKVVFVAVDLGQGILNSLRRKFSTQVIDWMTKSDQEVLEGAFDRKYGSKSADINRNNGLPSIRALAIDNLVDNLCVVTNNVLLNFADKNRSVTFAGKKSAFMGTLYTWELSLNSLKNIDYDSEYC